MKIFRGLCALLIGGFIFAGCQQEQPSSPPPSSTVTHAPSAAVEIPAQTNAAAADKRNVLSPEEARNHVGEVATVRGKVFGVYVSRKNDIFINVGAAHPNQPFTVVCFQEAIPAEDLKKLEGKTVSFTGTIKEHNGQAEIILDRAEQISE